jgi:hypothetical protein
MIEDEIEKGEYDGELNLVHGTIAVLVGFAVLTFVLGVILLIWISVS